MRKPTGPGDTPIVGIAGWKKSGKTMLTIGLIEELARRGLKVATVKHAHHAFDVDTGSTDSARHRKAGAREVAIVSKLRWAMVGELAGQAEPDFRDVVQWFRPCDLIIVEGYKTAPIPKIETRRTDAFEHTPLSPRDPFVVAIAADHRVADAEVPVFDLSDILGIADFLTAYLGLSRLAATSKPLRVRKPRRGKGVRGKSIVKSET
ncbi:MAG: molybdopterin-guanine dinucleotide biosynthesis protein B [Hyphomicrobiaceae bacterium]|nr:MAG: molybdopterin-guanine dinucleotide biosynthesis protein B [Hyphomicrobiaceae bacterium]